jgi:hypothetical protein
MIGLEFLRVQDLLKAGTDNDSWNFGHFEESYLRTLFKNLISTELISVKIKIK